MSPLPPYCGKCFNVLYISRSPITNKLILKGGCEGKIQIKIKREDFIL